MAAQNQNSSLSFSFDSLPSILAQLQTEILDLRSKVESAQPEIGRIVNGVQLCEVLDITAPTLIRWRKAGKIPFMSIGGAYRYDINAVVAAIANSKK